MDISNIPAWVEQVKWLISVGGAFWVAFKAYTYVTTSLGDTQKGVKGIKDELSQQTTALIKAADGQTHELQELRTDVGRMISAMMVPPIRARAARAARRKK
jgi:hypothetical protein